MKKISAFLRIMRPAGIVVAIADVLAGVTIAGRFENGLDKTWVNILLLCTSTAFLYAGGVVYNDVFDADVDAVTHPERPIPAGIIKITQAKIFGVILFVIGIASAALGSSLGGFIALGITFFALIYDKWGKHNTVFGPLNLGICRGLNLILGLSLVPGELQQWFFLALIPIIYIYAVTLIGRGGATGSKNQNLKIGAVLYLAVIGTIIYQADYNGELDQTLLILLPFALTIFISLSNAIKHPVANNIRKAERSGTLMFILIDAAWAITFDSWLATAIIVCLLLISLWLAKVFPVS
jgi:hypothetical protein